MTLARKTLVGAHRSVRQARIGTTACHSALMFGRAIMAGEALVSMTAAGKALVGTIGIRNRCDPREV